MIYTAICVAAQLFKWICRKFEVNRFFGAYDSESWKGQSALSENIYKSTVVMAAIQRVQIWTCLPYSPDLTLSYSYLSTKMRKELLDSSGDVTAAVDHILEFQDAVLKASICSMTPDWVCKTYQSPQPI